jgi:hypothetical protein
LENSSGEQPCILLENSSGEQPCILLENSSGEQPCILLENSSGEQPCILDLWHCISSNKSKYRPERTVSSAKKKVSKALLSITAHRALPFGDAHSSFHIICGLSVPHTVAQCLLTLISECSPPQVFSTLLHVLTHKRSSLRTAMFMEHM